MIWHGMVRYVAWHEMVWYGMSGYDTVQHSIMWYTDETWPGQAKQEIKQYTWMLDEFLPMLPEAMIMPRRPKTRRL